MRTLGLRAAAWLATVLVLGRGHRPASMLSVPTAGSQE